MEKEKAKPLHEGYQPKSTVNYQAIKSNPPQGGTGVVSPKSNSNSKSTNRKE